jgi:hypothetical protein
MKLLRWSQILCLLFSFQSWANSSASVRFQCKGELLENSLTLIQYQRDGLLDTLFYSMNGLVRTTKLMGNPDFPVTSEMGETLYGTPPFTDVKMQLVRKLDTRGWFSIRFFEGRLRFPLILDCWIN